MLTVEGAVGGTKSSQKNLNQVIAGGSRPKPSLPSRPPELLPDTSDRFPALATQKLTARFPTNFGRNVGVSFRPIADISRLGSITDMKFTMVLASVATAIAVSACHRTTVEQAQSTNARAMPAFKSAIDQVRIVQTSYLPPNPKRTAVDEYCSSYVVVKPKTPGGRLAAGRGWIVTSETKLGHYDAITFVGLLDPPTSATCAHVDGNLAMFDEQKLMALAYLKPTSASMQSVSSRGGDTVAEDSLGSAEQIDAGRIRLSYGLPSGPFADVVLGKEITVEPIAEKDAVCGGTAFVPNVFGSDIRKARLRLIAYGWLPTKPAEAPSGIVPPGVVEVEDCAGTGYGFCAFNYRHRKGFGLRVISMGEEYSVEGYSPYCSGMWKDRFGQ